MDSELARKRFEGFGSELRCVELHWLPCKVSYSGETAFSKRFKPENNEASFRGRHLKGEVVKFPEGFRGVTVEKKDGNYRVVSSAGEQLTYWNHDDVPYESIDPVPRAFNWLHVSTALAKRISAADVEALSPSSG
ncbi:hypothetical protein NDN08_003789 [Rhodosorus marinus]|uniref:Uncharacterized protein n=1 Tax=Rhodosorus marinus TaxID=101924 RepID=A0AAV8UGG5_9RHOD|nr:hypothetical protein NDN08_003789 [Rhodosorus marinus]